MDLERVIAALAPRDVVGRAPLDVADLAYDTRAVTPAALPASATARRRRQPRGHGHSGGRLLRPSDARARGRRRHRHEREDDDGAPRLLDPRRGRAPAGPPRHDRGAGGRGAAARRADDAGGDRPPAHVPRDAGCGRPKLRDGGLLARNRAPPPRPRPLRRARVHEPDARAPRLPRHDGALLRREAAALRRGRAAAGGDQRRRPLGPQARGRAAGRAHLRARRRRAARTGRPGWHRPQAPRPLQRRERARRGRGRPNPGDRRCRRRAGPGGGAGRPRPLRVGRRGPAVRGGRRLLTHPRLTRERPPRSAGPRRDRPRPLRLRLRRRPRPRQAPADGPGRERARRRADPHDGQPAQRGSAGHHRRGADRRVRRGRGRARPACRDRAGGRGCARRRRGARRRPGRGTRAGGGGEDAAVRRPRRRARGAAAPPGGRVIPLPLAEMPPGRLDAAPGTREITGVTIDSRLVEPGDLFVAVGRGVEFLEDARARGAAATLVPDDAFAAMAALGAAVRDRSSARVVGITGSMGKTGTKDILAALCRPQARTVAAEASFNNELGVITNVGPVHLELVGDLDGVRRAKAELVDALPPGGTAIVPEEFPVEREDVRVVRVGLPEDAAVEDGRTILGGVSFGFTARHQAANAAAALAALDALGLPRPARVEVPFSRWRGDELPLPGGGLLINDAYNANPVSMRAALALLGERAGPRRRVAILGDMAELGAEGPRYHCEGGAVDAELGVQALVAIGPLARGYVEGAEHVRVTRWAPTLEESLEIVREVVEPGDCVLVKGSRAMGLE